MKEREWISFHIYTESPIDSILISYVKVLIEELTEKRQIKDFFFVRYWEPKQHIRLRLLANEGVEDTIKTNIQSYTAAYIKQNPLIELFISFQIYTPEIERYGGYQNIISAEKQFCLSSSTIISLISENSTTWDYSLSIATAIQMHVILIREFCNNDSLLIAQFFQQVYINWFYYSLKVDESGNASVEEITKVQQFFEDSFMKQKGNLKNIIRLLESDDYIKNTWIYDWKKQCGMINDFFSESNTDIKILNYIYDSLIHMSNNRLGIHLRDESFIAYLINRSITDK